jgi:hypothetical protein
VVLAFFRLGTWEVELAMGRAAGCGEERAKHPAFLLVGTVEESANVTSSREWVCIWPPEVPHRLRTRRSLQWHTSWPFCPIASGPRKSHTYSPPPSTQSFATDVKHLNHQVRHIDGRRSVAHDAQGSEHGLRNHMPTALDLAIAASPRRAPCKVAQGSGTRCRGPVPASVGR